MKLSCYHINVIRIKTTLSSACISVLSFIFIYFSFIQVTQAQENKSLNNLGSKINSIYEEMNPILSPDGKTLYFCRGRHPENFGGRKDKGDIWFSVKDANGNWQKAQNIGAPLNNIYKNDLAGISADGNILYLNYTYGQNEKNIGSGLSYSKKTPSGWSAPITLKIPYFYNASDHQSVFISGDEKIILLSLDSYGTYGAEDLYVSFKHPSGEWTEPMNLGPEINSIHQEITPFLANDNKTLFFVTNGRESFGSKDIYKSQRLDNTWRKWSKPQNLGPQVNTEGMEMYYFQDKSAIFAYIVSTQNSDGYGDIYQIKIRQQDTPDELIDENFFPNQLLVNEEVEDAMFQVPDTVIVFNLDAEINEEAEEDIYIKSVYGKVLNDLTKGGILASIVLENDQNVKKSISDEESGLYKINIDDPGKFKISISARGYFTKESVIEIQEGDSSLEFNCSLTPLEIGATFQLHDVLFGQGTAEILENSFSELDKVAVMMLENPKLFIELAGHTDNQGIARLNIKLSQERVENVKKYLVKKGVDAHRISGKGYGGIKPIASNKNEETRKLNRRVEFTIVKN